METQETTKQTIQMKATKVNQFEFEKTYSSSNELRKDFRAKVAVQIGNAVINTTVCMVSEYFSPTYNESTNERIKDGYYTYTPTVDKKPFEALEKIGLDIDFSEIILSYEFAVDAEKNRIEKEKEEAERLEKIKRGVTFDNAWIHTFSETVSSDKNKEIKWALECGVTYSFPSKQRYVDNKCQLYVDIEYKGFTVTIFKNSDGHYFTGASTLESDGITKRHVIFNDQDKCTKGKTVGNIFLKAIQGVDKYIAIKNYKQTQKEKEEAERKAYVQILKDASGEPIYSKKEWVSGYVNGRRQHDGYDVHKYYVRIKEKTETQSEVDVVISGSQKQNYNSITKEYDKMPYTFTIGGIQGLNSDQLKGIIAIIKQ